MKTTRRRGVDDAATPQAIRLNIRIDAEARKRLAVHCAMTGLEPGEVITRLVLSLRDWSMPVNLAAKSSNTHRAVQVSQISDTAQSPTMESAA